MKPVSVYSTSARPYTYVVCPYVRPSTKRFFSDFNEIWHVGRGPRELHDYIPHVPIQGQGYGQKIAIWSISMYLLRWYAKPNGEL